MDSVFSTGAIPSSSSSSKRRRVRVAIVGAGDGARENFATAILQNEKFHLRALWSRTKVAADRFNLEVAGRSLEVFYGEDGFAQLLERPDIEGYAVALPPEVQADYVARILHKRRHVISQAPVAPDRKSAQQTLTRVESAVDGPIWFISDHLRYESVLHPDNLKIDEFTPIVATELYAVLVVPRSAGPPRTDESLFIEGGVQHIAVLRQLLGQITLVNCTRVSHQIKLLRDGLQEASPDGVEKGSSSGPPDAPDGNVFYKDALSGTLRFECGTVCAVNWQTSSKPQDARFRLTLYGVRGTATVELDMCSQASISGLRPRYTLLRGSDSQQSLSAGKQQRQLPKRQLPVSFTSCGVERQLDAWGRAIRSFSLKSERSFQEPEEEDPAAQRDQSPLHAIIDLIVVGAMLQSRGTTVQIRPRQQGGEKSTGGS